MVGITTTPGQTLEAPKAPGYLVFRPGPDNASVAPTPVAEALVSSHDPHHALGEDWRVVFAVLREKALPSMMEHADRIERLLERHGPDESMVTLSLTDGVFLRSFNWVHRQLGIPLPVD